MLSGRPVPADFAPQTFLDALGRTLSLTKAPARIVSLAPSITEILFAIGLDTQIVGVTDFCDYPPEAILKPKVGYSNPNLESLLGLHPDLVLAPKTFLRAELLGKLDQLKIPAYILEAKSVEDIFLQIQTIGRMVNRSSMADGLATRLRHRLAAIQTRTADLPRPRVLYVINSHPLISVGPGSFIHHIVELAGATNIAAEAPTPYPRLSMEVVIGQDPEIIIFPVGHAEGIPESEQRSWNRWNSLSAVKHGRLYQISADLMNRPGPRIVEALEALTNLIHPDASLPENPSS